jgi:hypothetical protein
LPYLLEMNLEPDFLPEIGFSSAEYPFPITRNGNTRLINENTFPKEAFVKSDHKVISDFVPINGRLAVSSRVKSLVDALEPDINQFIPVRLRSNTRDYDLYYNDCSLIAEPFYYVNILSILDAISLENSSVKVLTRGVRRYIIRQALDSKVCLKKDLIRGKHLWEGRIHLPGSLFSSDELMDKIRSAGLTGLDPDYLATV